MFYKKTDVKRIIISVFLLFLFLSVSSIIPEAECSDIKQISELSIGDKVIDHSWDWKYRKGVDYTSEGEVKPVVWIVAAKNHYSDIEAHITLIAQEPIAIYIFDNSTDQASEWGSNHWGNSGSPDASKGIRPWLNSKGIHEKEGFYNSFSEEFKSLVLTTVLPNKEWSKGSPYVTNDNVFIPSSTELGDTSHSWTYEIGTVYPYFDQSKEYGQKANLGNNVFFGEKDKLWYWTRSPVLNNAYAVRCVPYSGGFSHKNAGYDQNAVRPALNISYDAMVKAVPNADGIYEIIYKNQVSNLNTFILSGILIIVIIFALYLLLFRFFRKEEKSSFPAKTAEAFNSKTTDKIRPKLRRKYIIGSFSLLIIITIVILFKTYGIPMIKEDKDKASFAGNTLGNIANFGFVAGQAEWIFYNSEEGLVKSKADGNNRKIITGDDPVFINVLGDWVYYSVINNEDPGVYKVRTNGKGRTRLFAGEALFLNVTNGMVYFSITDEGSDPGIYKLDAKGKGQERLTNEPALFVNVSDDWVYYAVGNKGDGGIRKIRTDGTDKAIITESPAFSLNVIDDWVYYSGFSDKNTVPGIYKVKTDGSTSVQIIDEEATYINVDGQWIYYTDTEQDSLYKIKVDGTDKAIIAEHNVGVINLVDKWIFYDYENDKETFTIYRIKADGSSQQWLY